MSICSRCKWQVPNLVDGLCDYCYDIKAMEKAVYTHFHECPDCSEVWRCISHDCDGSGEYRCADCFMQLRLLECNE